MPKKDDDISESFLPYENEKYTLKEQKIEKDHRNLIRKISNTKNRARDGLSRYISQAGLFAN